MSKPISDIILQFKISDFTGGCYKISDIFLFQLLRMETSEIEEIIRMNNLK